ncbi:MAG: hypothetical protein AB8C95_04650 [Phycisphaeraceae bacterium]
MLRSIFKPTGLYLAFLTLALATIAGPATGQTFLGELTDKTPTLDNGSPYNFYNLRCEGGEAIRISFLDPAFEGYMMIKAPHKTQQVSLQPQLLPEPGTFFDLIAEHPGEYRISVVGRRAGEFGSYKLDIQPLTQGKWVTKEQVETLIQNGESKMMFMSMDFTGRVLAYSRGNQPTLAFNRSTARGSIGPSEPFGQAGSALVNTRLKGFSRPIVTATFLGEVKGDTMKWAVQNYVSQERIEKQRRIAPEVQFYTQFPEQGPQEASFTIELGKGQYFFGYVAHPGKVKPEPKGADGERPASTLDYVVSMTGPDGVNVEESASPYSAEVRAPVDGIYTFTVKAGERPLPADFTVAYQQGRSVPALDAPVAWSTRRARAILEGKLDQSSKNDNKRRYQTFKIKVKAGDRVVADVWSQDFKPSVMLATPDKREIRNEAINDSSMHAFASFIAKEDGLCTLHVIGRTPEDAGSFKVSLAVLDAKGGKSIIPADPLAR